MSEHEVWRPIPGHEGKHEVSNFGRITRNIFLLGQEKKILQTESPREETLFPLEKNT